MKQWEKDVLKLAKETASKLSEEDCQLLLQMKEKPLKVSHTWRASTIHEKGLTTWTSDGWVLSSFGRKVLENILAP